MVGVGAYQLSASLTDCVTVKGNRLCSGNTAVVIKDPVVGGNYTIKLLNPSTNQPLPTARVVVEAAIQECAKRYLVPGKGEIKEMN